MADTDISAAPVHAEDKWEVELCVSWKICSRTLCQCQWKPYATSYMPQKVEEINSEH